MSIVIEKTEAMPAKDVFASFYVIPDFQREFVWRQKQVDQLLWDIYGAYESGDEDNYFLGSIVVFKTDHGKSLAIVDGQQRLTTLYLLFCAVRDRLKDFSEDANVATLDKAILDTDIDPSGNTVLRHRMELRYKPSNKVLHAIGEGHVASLDLGKADVGRPLLDAYRLCRQFLIERFGEDNEAGIKKFHAFVLLNLELIRVTSGDFQSALTIFEVLNYRGVVLNAMDLLKNLLFREAPESQHSELVATWEHVLATLRKGGERRPLRFLRYHLVATYDFPKMPKASELFQWILDHDDAIRYSNNPLRFAKELAQASQDYINIRLGLDPWEDENLHLMGIRYQRTGVSQYLPLLMAGAGRTQSEFTELARHVEALVLAYTLAGAQWNDIEQALPGWCGMLREVKSSDDFARFLAQLRRKTSEVAPTARESLAQTNQVGSSLLKYILAKLTHHIEVACGKDDDFFKYFKRGVTIEHILPQRPSEEALDAFGTGSAQATYRLGNLTLLYGGPNAIARNKPFQQKATLYEKSDFELTKSLVVDISLGKQDKTKKTADRYGLRPFSTWSGKEVAIREEMLLEIAADVWGI